MNSVPSALSATSILRVIYGESILHFKDFSRIDGVLSFVRRLRSNHPEWTIGDSFRDQISVCELFWSDTGCRDTRDCSAYVSELLVG